MTVVLMNNLYALEFTVSKNSNQKQILHILCEGIHNTELAVTLI
jgi:hypothetical protein